MKWKLNKRPNIMDKRRIKRFAFFPTNVSDEHTSEEYIIWLEHYTSYEWYVHDRFWNISYWDVLDKYFIDCSKLTPVPTPQDPLVPQDR